MRSLRIFVNDIELDYVREDLKIREENNSFNDSIKVAHTVHPIRIIENEAAAIALGEFSITTARKKKFFDCVIIRGAIRYRGVLTQNEKIKGFRKCDLKYGSEINGIMDKRIASFFPSVNVKGEVGVSYTEVSDSKHEAHTQWTQLAEDMKSKIYPEVKWQLPQLRYKDKFGTDLKEDDTWYDYNGYINFRWGILWPNDSFVDENNVIAHNRNVIAPQVFALSPLFYAFSSIGYSLQGNVVNSPFFKRLLLLSHEDNMTKIVTRVTGFNFFLTPGGWQQKGITGIIGPFPYPTYIQLWEHATTSAGDFKVVFKFDMSNASRHLFGIQGLWQGDIFGNFMNQQPDVYEESFLFTVAPEQVGQIVSFRFHSEIRHMPVEYYVEVIKDLPDKDFYDTHPTIDFSRYIPEWTVAEYINNFQRLFNWRVVINDVEKSISINFNEDDYLINGSIVPIQKSLQITGINNIDAESYILKYENDEDDFQFISQDVIEENREGDTNTKTLETKFKYIPHQGGTSNLTEAVEDKNGVGLIIYDPINHPNTSESYQGKNLKITGQGGICDTHWRRWILFRLNAGNVKLKGPFTQTELYKIAKDQKLYIDNQLWLVKAVEYKENNQALFETEIEVESVTF